MERNAGHITKRFTFEAAHRLPNHDGKCRRLHGHSYRVEISVSGLFVETEGAPDQGMVIDFGVVTKAWKEIEEIVDHRTILWQSDPLLGHLYDGEYNDSCIGLDVPPTAENIATWIREEMSRRIDHLRQDVFVAEVTVWETENSWATV